MTNWQERINSEINRRKLQTSAPTQKPINATDWTKERQKIEGEEAMRKLRPEDLRMLGLLDRLGVKHMLEEIRNEVWGGHGIIRQQEFAFENWVGKQLCLAFEYKYPKPTWTYVYDKKFGSYEVYHSQPATSRDGTSYDTGYSETKFGRHEAESGYGVIESCEFHETGAYITIDIRKDYQGFVLDVHNDNNLKLNPQSLDETEVKKFLEKYLLENCIERKKGKDLPTDILEKVRYNQAIIEQAIREKRKFRFDKDGMRSIEWNAKSLLGLV